MENKSTESAVELPTLFVMGPRLEFDINDVDGHLAMIDREFSGGIQLAFSRQMDPNVAGTVLLDGKNVEHIVTSFQAGSFEAWVLSVKVFGVLTEYGQEHSLKVAGFADPAGLVMEPADFVIYTGARQEPEPRFADHERLAQQVAEDGIVLLKNNKDLLPLRHGQLNILGSALQYFRTSVVGAGRINPRYTVGLREAIEGHHGFTLNAALAEFHRVNGDSVPPEAILAAARAASDIGIVVLSRLSGENMDNSSDPGEFYLSDDEDRLLKTVAEKFPHSVVVLNTPYPIDVRFVESYGIDAVVLAGVGGMLAGPALLNVLDGTVSPSGALPDTWANDITDIPAHRNFYDFAGRRRRYTGDSEVWIDTAYEEGIYVGYRYFSTFGVDVAYPFGHGLSYTSFAVEAGPVTVSEHIHLTAQVENTGHRPGREVLQLYVAKPDGELEQPTRELVDFAKTALLAPQEAETVEFDIPLERLFTFDDTVGRYTLVAGEYILFLGRSVGQATEIARFPLRERMGRTARARLLVPEPLSTLSRNDRSQSWPRGERSGVRSGATGFAPVRPIDDVPRFSELASAQAERSAELVTFADVQANPERARDFAALLTVEQLVRLTVCAQSAWGMEGSGVAGILAQPEGLDIPQFEVADGNSGVNVKKPNIGLPTTVILASTFDKDLAERFGQVLGEEARELSVNLILAPALNLHRHPLNGRHPEYFSEDPYLSGVMAGHYARGLESTGVGACYKHFAANNAESARKRNQSVIPERALRDLYLKAFEVALSVHQPKTVMTAYNAINGRPTATDPELLDGVLRDEFGFRGMVMTDWGSDQTSDVVDIVGGGNNWVTPGSLDDEFTVPLLDAIADGRLAEDRLRQSVSYLLETVARLTPKPPGHLC